MSLGIFIYTKIFGKLVGIDELGNKYYESKSRKRWFGKNNRWVIYDKRNELVANIQTRWFKWLHYMSDVPPMKLQTQCHWIVEGGVTEYNKLQPQTIETVYDGKYSVWNHKNN
jgi:NADH:ubiquinone oxidoreductase subunit